MAARKRGGSPFEATVPSSPDDQRAFLDPWYEFCRTGDLRTLDRALERIAVLGASRAFFRTLAELLEADGGDREASRKAVADAGARLVRHVCTRGVEAIGAAWSPGRREECVVALAAVRRLPLEEGDEEIVLAPLLALGDRLAEELAVAPDPTGPFVGWKVAPECVEIEALGEAVGRHPSAGRWFEEAVEHRTGLAGWIRDAAIDLANDSEDYAGATTLIEKAMSLKPSVEMRERLEEDLWDLRGVAKQARDRDAWAGVAPMRSVPTLGTLNGIGLTMYGFERFEGDPTCQIANHYFTVFFIPVFPLASYVARREDGGWRFFGRVAWNTAMKVHLAVSVALILFGGWWIGHAPSPAALPPEAPSYDAPAPEASEEGDLSFSNPAAPRETPAVPAPNKNLESYESWQEKKAKKDAAVSPPKELESQRVALKAGIDRMNLQTDVAWKDIETRRAVLKKLDATIEAMTPKGSPQATKAYNARVDDYEAKRAALNRKIKAYNATLNEEKRTIAKYNEIVERINSGDWR